MQLKDVSAVRTVVATLVILLMKRGVLEKVTADSLLNILGLPAQRDA